MFFLGDLYVLTTKTEADLSNIAVKHIYNPNDGISSCFQITSEFYGIVKKLYRNNVLGSSLFNCTWEKKVQRLTEETDQKVTYSHMEILENVVEPTLMELTTLVQTLVDGEILFHELQEIFKESQLSAMLSELEMLTSLLELNYERKDIKACVSKVKCFFQLQKSVDRTAKILHVREVLGLVGNFETIMQIHTQVIKPKYFVLEKSLLKCVDVKNVFINGF